MSALRTARSNGIVTAILDRPERRNAIDVPTWEALADLCAEVAGNDSDRVLILTGAGGHFSAGGDLTGRGAPGESPIDTMRRTVNRTCLALHQLPKPTLAAVPGLAAGAGANLAFGCDLVLAARSARFAELFVDRGLPLDSGASWLLPRLIGMRRAKELSFFGDWISAEQAQAMGLVNRVVEDEMLEAEAQRWALRLTEKSPGALAAIKAALQPSFQTHFEDALENEARALVERTSSPEFQEQMARFARRSEGSARPNEGSAGRKETSARRDQKTE